MELKKATKEDVAAIAALEARCFPKLEAATEASVRDRVAVYPNHFLLLFDGTRLVSFVNGFVTDERILRMKCMKRQVCMMKMGPGR